MRYVNGAMDPEKSSPERNKKVSDYLAGADPRVKEVMINVINLPEWLTDEASKMEMLYYLDDEDFENERFAIISLVNRVVRMTNAADSYAGD